MESRISTAVTKSLGLKLEGSLGALGKSVNALEAKNTNSNVAHSGA